MSASAQGSTNTTKAVVSDNKNGEPATEQKPAAPLEEDDEFEDFPLEGM
jgi:26 proteasome complex subunit DSS1